jgi:hypothetical protein
VSSQRRTRTEGRREELVNHTKKNYIHVFVHNVFVHDYTNKTTFKYQRICKIWTANMWAYYMKSVKYMHSFLIVKVD